MAYIRTNKSKGHEYYAIVENYREGKSVKHRTLEYIGSIKELKAYALKGYYAMHEKESDKEQTPAKPEDV